MVDQPAVTRIDHPVIAMRDMAAGRAAYERLGFTVTPRGSHLEWGTGNWCIMFADDYLELRGIIDPSHTHNLAQFLQEREGLMGIAFGSDDAEASYRALVDRGLRPQPVRQLTRNFELPEGVERPRFSLCFLDAADAPGLMSVVLCQHLTPELLRRPKWLRHANGAMRVRGMTGVVRDLQSASASYRKLFGSDAVRAAENRIRIQFENRQFIELLAPSAAEAAFSGFDVSASGDADYLCSVAIGVANVSATRDFFQSRGCEIRPTAGGTLCVHPREACGVILEFAE